MTELSDTAFIAERLFGWKADKRTRGVKWTRWTREPYDVAIVYDDGINPDSPWPKLDDWNDIRRMEDALSKESLYFDYARHLCTMVSGMDYFIGSNQTPDWLVCLRATAPQRVAAAVKVLRELDRAELEGRAK